MKPRKSRRKRSEATLRWDEGKLGLPLAALETDKWRKIAQYVIHRQDGRDVLCYHTLLRALNELLHQRARTLRLVKRLDDICGLLYRATATEVRHDLEQIVLDLGEDIRDFEMAEPPLPPNLNPALALEVVRAGLVAEINDQILHPRGFNIRIHPENISSELPNAVTFERWDAENSKLD